MANVRGAGTNNGLKWYQNKWITVPLGLIVLLITFVFIRKVKEDKKKKGASKENAELASDIASQNPGMSNEQALQRALVLKEMAQKISVAFWSFKESLFGTVVTWRLTEDEDEAINELKQIKSLWEAGTVSDLYKEYNDQFDTGTLLFPAKKGMSLLADCKKFLSASEFANLPAAVRQGLK